MSNSSLRKPRRLMLACTLTPIAVGAGSLAASWTGLMGVNAAVTAGALASAAIIGLLAAMALKNPGARPSFDALTERDEQARERQLAAQIQILRELTHASAIFHGDVATTCRKITEVVARGVDTTRVNIWRFSDDGSHLRCLDHYDLQSGVHSQEGDLPVADFPAYFASLREQEIIGASDARNDPRTREFTDPYLDPNGIASLLDAPIRLNGEVIGVVCLEHVGDVRHWSEVEEQFAQTLADLASLVCEADERRKTEQALRESEERLEALAHQLPGVIYVYDRLPCGRRRMVYAGHGFEQLLGPEAGAAVREDVSHLLDRLHPDDRNDLLRRARRASETGEILQIEIRLRRDSGEYRWCRSIGRAVPLDGGGERWYIVLIDAQEQHESAQQLRLLIEQTPGVIYRYEKHPDGSRRSLFVGPGFEELLGRESARAIETDINALFDRVHPDDLNTAIPRANAAAERGETISALVRIRTDRGEYRWMESIGSPEQLANGATRWSVILVDCQERMELRRERERLADALEATTDFVSITDATGELLFLNSAGRKMLGLGHEHLLLSAAQFKTLVPKSSEGSPTDGAWAGESTLKTCDGRSIAVSQVTLHHLDADGKLEYTTTIARDLTEWKNAERELRDTLERNRSIMACSPDHIMLVDLEGHLEFINRTVPDLDIDRVLGTSVFTYMPESVHQSIRACFQRVAATAQPDRYETPYMTGDGDERIFECHVGPVTRGGSVASLIISARDVTEQRRTQQALADSEQQMRLITNALPVLISHIDEHGKYQYNNATYTAWFGVRTDELKGKSPADLLSAEEYQSVEPFLKRALAGEQTSFETMIHDAHGNDRYVDVTNVPHIDMDGRVRGVYAVVNDISASKKEAERRSLMMRELDHRVKNNLAAILSLAQQTIATSASLEEFSDSFVGRVHAMATTHELLAEAHWSGLDLERGAQLVLAPFVAFGRNRIVMAGPRTKLPSQAAMPICLTLFELATNAVKHGALSVPEGSVHLNWDPGNGRIRLRWRERNGPIISDHIGSGVGMELIRGFVEYELRGALTIDLQADGVSCLIDVPLELPTDQGRRHADEPVELSIPAAAD